MNRKLIAIAALGLFMVVFSSCFEREGTSKFLISNEFKAYTAFLPGSYWVYKHLETNRLDTVYLIDSDTATWFQFAYGSTSQGYFYDVLQFYYAPNALGMDSSVVYAAGVRKTNYDMVDVWRVYYGQRYNIIFDPKPETNAEQDFGNTLGFYTLLVRNEPLVFQELSYGSVWQTRVRDYFNPANIIYLEYSIARNFGIVRFRRTTNDEIHTWELVDSELFQ